MLPTATAATREWPPRLHSLVRPNPDTRHDAHQQAHDIPTEHEHVVLGHVVGQSLALSRAARHSLPALTALLLLQVAGHRDELEGTVYSSVKTPIGTMSSLGLNSQSCLTAIINPSPANISDKYNTW